jgi:hypothetical protein
MKELEVKSMLSDPSIPDSYKLGGRLDERFLAGVEYAEAVIEKAPLLWAARDKDDEVNFFANKPSYDVCYNSFMSATNSKAAVNKWFPEITWENSPKKVRLILEDEE